jgi:response regulator RpfG family c-di-GMP phosphodiesterase
MTEESRYEACPAVEQVLNSISWYARDYSLSPEQVKEIFHAGLLSCFNAGKIKLPTMPPFPCPAGRATPGE